MTDEERDELLIRVDERGATLETQFNNHIKHHWLVTIPVLMIALGLLVALLSK